MTFDATTLLKGVKQAAVEAVETQRPFSLIYGEVTSADPLTISVDQDYEIDEDQIILTNAVRDYVVKMEVDHTTETADGHVHGYSGTKEFKVKLALKKGETVIMLRADGGQDFIVLDRVEAPE